MDGFTRLRESRADARVSLRELAQDLADYAAMRPETARVLDALASYLAGLHPTKPAPREPQVLRTLLPGEAEDVVKGADPHRWVDVYQQLVDAADITGVNVEVQVHLLSRLSYWQSRLVDAELIGRNGETTAPLPITPVQPHRG